jgi:hypothetical protein
MGLPDQVGRRLFRRHTSPYLDERPKVLIQEASRRQRMNGLIREEWLKLDKNNNDNEPEPDRVCLDCHKPLDQWLTA